MRRLRVCRVINALWMGGVQRRLMQLLPLLRERGADCEVCAIRSEGELAERFRRELGVPVTVLPVEGRLQPAEVWKLARYFRERRFDVVHAHMYSAAAPAAPAAFLARVPVRIAQAHNVAQYRRPSQARTDRMLMPLRHAYLAVSEAVRQDLAQRLRLPPERFDVLHNGIDLDAPATRPRSEVRAELGLAPGDLALLHVARLHPQKGHRAFLRTLPAILRDAPGARWIVVGDGEERAPLEALAAELGVAHAVRFLGTRHDVHDLYAAADAAILPSLKEGFSNVVLEAMLFGCPVVASDVGGAREQITHGADGLVAPGGDPDAFARECVGLLRDPGLRSRIAQAGRGRVRDFGLERMAERTLEIYQRYL
ncbi:MAG: glycosyltransferase [Candidatus Sumerlaeia bacterium]|nr:glycosyltransferase [Candidatus Sumerlaeia bacterium]